MFFEKVRTVDVTNDELTIFKDFILDVVKKESNVLDRADEQRGSQYFTPEEMNFTKTEWAKIGFSPASFYGFSISKIKNYQTNSKLDFIKRAFNVSEIGPVSVILISNGMLVTPHIDVIAREYCWNFPIWNYENSRTLFYKRIDYSRDTKIFLPTEIELEHEVHYEPNTIYKINTQIPHSIRLNDPSITEPRIMLSYPLS